MPSIREITEQNEKRILCEEAVKACESRGRVRQEEECEVRTCFQRDRDRVIHCKAFRRLKHKTQVFLSPESDHYRTRLTHTLEVTQIARTLARALRLNEDLTEAIALAHDIGHTPFGHAGERALNAVCAFDFTHYEQSVRICEKLERNGMGLNLTAEVLDGILHHTRGEWAHTLEGRVVRYADRIAYINHDIEDAVSAGILQSGDIPREICRHLGNTKSERIDTLVKAVIRNGTQEIGMDDETERYFEELHSFLFEHVYTNPVAKSEESKVLGFMEALYAYFLEHTAKLPAEARAVYEREGADRAVADYIAGMTDQFAISTYTDLFIPRSWTVPSNL